MLAKNDNQLLAKNDNQLLAKNDNQLLAKKRIIRNSNKELFNQNLCVLMKIIVIDNIFRGIFKR